MNVLWDILDFLSDWAPRPTTHCSSPATSYSSFYDDVERYQRPSRAERQHYSRYYGERTEHISSSSNISRLKEVTMEKKAYDRRELLVEELRARNTILARTASALEHDIAVLRQELELARHCRDETARTSEGLRAKTATLERELADARASAHAHYTEASHLRADNAALQSACVSADAELRQQSAEMQTLRAFLTKTDSWTGNQVLQAVTDLCVFYPCFISCDPRSFTTRLRQEYGNCPSSCRYRRRVCELVRPLRGLLSALASGSH
jgi:hypothetical protein